MRSSADDPKVSDFLVNAFYAEVNVGNETLTLQPTQSQRKEKTNKTLLIFTVKSYGANAFFYHELMVSLPIPWFPEQDNDRDASKNLRLCQLGLCGRTS